MPYISQFDRHREFYHEFPKDSISLDSMITHMVDIINLVTENDRTKYAGICNYVITSVLLTAMQPEGGWRYDNINSAIGVLECAKLELYRRLGGPYEDQAIEKNGDLPEYESL